MLRKLAPPIAVFVAALLLGAFSAPDSTASPNTAASAATSTSRPRESDFIASGETYLGPAVLVAESPALADGEVTIPFELVGLAPTGDAAGILQLLYFGNSRTIPPDEIDTVYPDQWQLEVGADRIPGTVASPNARTARFQVGEDFDADQIDKVTITSYRLLVPISAEVSFGSGVDNIPVAPGITARLIAVTEQANTIIQIELTSEADIELDHIRVTGTGPGWLASVPEAEGRPRWNLTYDSPSAPESISILVEGAIWISVPGDYEVEPGGFS